MAGYMYFAEFYDILTNNINYQKYADYLLELLSRYKHKAGLTLDLACGTGNLTICLKQKGIDIFGVDISSEMLSIAKEKASEQGVDILYLCQKMQQLDLYGTVDTVFCTMDSINHIADYNELQKAFNRVALFLNDGGYFIFDCNTVYKHRKILADNTFVYDTPQVYCIWQNHLIECENKVDIDLDFFHKLDSNLYEKYSEHFSERAYSLEEIDRLLTKSGLQKIDVFEPLTFQKPTDTSERLIIVAKK